MTLDEFREDLINNINAEALENSDYPVDIFIDYTKDILINDFGVLSDLNHTFCEYKTTNNIYRNMKLDASYLETSVNTLHLMYCDYNDGGIATINNEFINQKANLLISFFINVCKGYFNQTAESDIVTQTAKEIARKKDEINKLHLIIVSTNKKSERLKTTIGLKPVTIDNKEYQIDLTFLDISNIYETKLSGFKRDDIVIDVNDFGIEGIPCIKAEVQSDEYDSYLAVVPGKFLSDIYLKYSARLLEGNVRSFLNTRGEINKGILNTILNNKSKFFAYNNGIATTADEIKLKSTSKGLMITSFTNMQIINGGQTTASLASAVIKNNANLDGIYVQMKLSLIKNSGIRPELIRLISKYANKQNKVTSADLNSNHPYYTKIEDFSRRIKTPIMPNSTIQTVWFFERARGQYDQSKMQLKTKKERDVFERVHPKTQKFTKTDLAKYVNSAALKPYEVSWGAEVNMTKFQTLLEKEWEKNQNQFNELYYKELIAKAILFKHIEKIISNQEWYIANKGYRAQLVPYTFSKFIYEIEKKSKLFNYKRIWETQQVPDYYNSDIANIAKLCYDTFNDPNRQYLNIGEYAKREVCWNVLNKTTYQLSNETICQLIDKEDKVAEERQASKDQKLSDEVSGEIMIFNMGVDYWRKVREIGLQLKEISGYEADLCEVAIKYVKQIYPMLTKKQAKELVELKKKMDKYINEQ